MYYNFYYDIAAMILMAVLIIFFYEKNIIKTRLSSFFEIMLWATFIVDTLDFVRATLVSSMPSEWVIAGHVLAVLSLIATAMVPFFYYVYSLRSFTKARHLSTVERAVGIAVYAVVFGLIVSSPFTGLVYSISPDGMFSFGPAKNWLYLEGVVFSVHIIRTMSKKWGEINLTQKFSVMGGCTVVIVCGVMTIFMPQLSVVPFAMSIAVLLQYLSMEVVDDYTNDRLEVLNSNAFIDKVDLLISSKEDFEIFAVKLEGISYLKNVLGRQNANDMLKNIAAHLDNFSQIDTLFYLGANRFAILAEHSDVNWMLLNELINKYFKDTVEYGNITISIDTDICVLPAAVLRKTKKADDVIRLLDMAIDEARNSLSKDIYVATDSTLAETVRREEILHILKGAVREQQFQVYYQPIYSVKKQRYTSAEALVRLKDERLGYISPEEFIPIAEQNGLILEIGDFVFKTVCRCIMENNICDRGIEFIEVNLSVVQCMQERLYEQLISIMDEFRLPYHYINLEITESTAAMSKDTLKYNMEELIKRDINFALDDYGTGFSNMMRIVDYPFHAVKLDKSLLWSASDKPKAKHALEYSIQMIKAMELDVICEGVETFAQADMLEKMGCDYFQGYYFSRPVPTSDFLDILAREQAVALLGDDEEIISSTTQGTVSNT